jgi:multidrug efflux system membrane fusion protein
MQRTMTVGVGILLLMVLYGCKDKQLSHSAIDAPVPVVTARAETRAIDTTLRAVGNVEAIDTVVIVSRVDGQVAKVFVRDGQDMARNQPILQIDTASLDIQLRAAEAALARDEAKLENARVRADHGKAVLADHYISHDDYTQLKTDYESARATVDADRAERDNARLQLEYATIRAPVAGKLGHIAMQAGNMVHVSSPTPLTTLNVLDPIEVSLAVPEQNVGSLRAAFHKGPIPVQAEVTGDANDRKELVGDLTFIDNAVDATTGTIRLRARFDNADRTLWPGQFVATTLTLAGNTNSTVIPNAAIQEGPSGPYVFVVNKDSRVEQRSIQVIRTSDNDTAVAGVYGGEQVVTDGQSRLTPNSLVTQEHSQHLAGEFAE